jgi:hypothetical protein
MGLARGDAGSVHFEYPVVRQASEGRDVVSVRVALHAIFLFRNFSQCFLLDDFALRTILKTALNIEMHRSRDVFERSSRVFFCFTSDFFARGGSFPIAIHLKTAQAHAQTRTEKTKP